MSKQSIIDEFFENAQACLKKHQNGDPISDEELDDGLLLMSKMEEFANSFNMGLLKHWVVLREYSLNSTKQARAWGKRDEGDER